jgi:ketosteroid isomerase-like protein
MSQENVELSRAWNEAFNHRDLDAIRRLNHPRISWQSATEDPDVATHEGRDAVQHYIEGYFEVVPDLRSEQQECREASGGRVISTNRLFGRSAGGMPMEWRLTLVSTVEDGMFVRVVEYRDRDEALEAAGLSEQDAHANS